MTHKKYNSDIAFTRSVKTEQERRGSRSRNQKAAEMHDWPDRITDDLRAFIVEQNSFYLATATKDGQPYIQHRGGPKGFLKVIDERTLGFADFAGNRQYISLGNLSENNKAFIFLMDYTYQRRIKIWGRAHVVENDKILMDKLVEPDYSARPERALLFTIDAWDVNCRQHIPRKIDTNLVEQTMEKQRRRIKELEAIINKSN